LNDTLDLIDADDTARPATTTITAEALGATLARSLVVRASRPGDGVSSLAARLSLNPSRVTRELGYLSILTAHFCVGVVLKDEPALARVVAAFYRALWSGVRWGPHPSGLSRRMADYEDAFNNPDPELGRVYRVGREFARRCRAREDVAVIELGARAYLEQLPLSLDLLRGVSVV
jgi:hypothetical protein